MSTEIRKMPFPGAQGSISDKTLEIHHDKLYAGYVKKKDEIQEKLAEFNSDGFGKANQTYSDLRGLKDGETFAVNGTYLHEWYFENMGGDGNPQGEIAEVLNNSFGSFDKFVENFTACGMAARGWVVLAWDTHDKALRIYTGDAHNHGGVWGAIPLLVLDVYEHAYFIDFGSDRKAYIEEFFKHVNWENVNQRFTSVKS
ncbi:MAG: superoxide dismutase [Patescibacteria group bacterium]|nr:superoxide dismutase [Patescibacteria group bacterium]